MFCDAKSGGCVKGEEDESCKGVKKVFPWFNQFSRKFFAMVSVCEGVWRSGFTHLMFMLSFHPLTTENLRGDEGDWSFERKLIDKTFHLWSFSKFQSHVVAPRCLKLSISRCATSAPKLLFVFFLCFLESFAFYARNLFSSTYNEHHFIVKGNIFHLFPSLNAYSIS